MEGIHKIIKSDGKIRTIRISSQYSDRLFKYSEKFEKEERLFKFSKQSVWQLMHNHLKNSGIKDWYNFSLHNIRKTSENWLNFLGVNYLMLLKHFGHNRDTALNHYLTTDIYDSKYKFGAREILGDLYI